ncbi:MAG: hypothetical protein R2748_13005 [Bryobacterales bacterium]
MTFREADGHVKGDGSIRVLTSRDGETWESTGLVSEAGVDLRDPRISVTPDNRLMLLMGGSVYRDSRVRNAAALGRLFLRQRRDLEQAAGDLA